jgi:L-ascorbate metabolism protein UlaG (beta-lactamase superfamily)
MVNRMTVYCRWLGVAGVELSVGGQVLVIDPYFTRFPFRKMWIGPVFPNRGLIAEHVQHCDYILVTHPHFDHVMDVPAAAIQTGATVLGSRNTCTIMRASGVPAEQTRLIEPGDRLELGVFHVDVLPARHGRTPIDRLINGPVRADLKPPLRALDYRMDACYTFLVETGGLRVLIGSCETLAENIHADVLFVGTVMLTREPSSYYQALLTRVRPKIVIPYHWDDLYRPLSMPVRPTFEPPAWAIPPLRRVDLSGFAHMIDAVAPGTRVFVPEMFRSYHIDEL